MNNQEARSIAGIAGLARIPYLGPLFSVHDKDDTAGEVLLLVRPHLLTPPPNEQKTIAVHLGSDNKPITPL